MTAYNYGYELFQSGGMVDILVLETSALCVRIRIPLLAPKKIYSDIVQ